MTKDIIVSRRCMVGPNGYFGVEVVDGSVLVSVDFFRPEPDLDEGPANYPLHWCEYEITYGGQVIHSDKRCGIDSVEALLRAMVDAVGRMDNRGFSALDGSGRFGDVIPYLDAIPAEWFHDLRFAGTWPTWTAEEPVIFLHPDGRRVTGRIALGYPLPSAGPYRASCDTLLDGLEDHHGVTLEGDTPLQVLQLAAASLATRLHAFLASGGRVLRPDGSGELDLGVLFGQMMRPTAVADDQVALP